MDLGGWGLLRSSSHLSIPSATPHVLRSHTGSSPVLSGKVSGFRSCVLSASGHSGPMSKPHKPSGKGPSCWNNPCGARQSCPDGLTSAQWRHRQTFCADSNLIRMLPAPWDSTRVAMPGRSLGEHASSFTGDDGGFVLAWNIASRFFYSRQLC